MELQQSCSQSSPEKLRAVMEEEWSLRVCSRLKLVSTLKMWISRSLLPEARSRTPGGSEG